MHCWRGSSRNVIRKETIKIAQESYIGYVGTTSSGGGRGVYRIRLDARTGRIDIIDTQYVYNAGYLTLSPDRRSLYVLSEGMTFDGAASGGMVSFDISEGNFRMKSRVCTSGQRPCFVSCDPLSGEIYVGNFYGGQLDVFAPASGGGIGARQRTLTHEKKGPFGPGIHCAVKSPDGRYLLVLELSGDCIYIYDTADDFRPVYCETIEEGAMPRHMTFRADGRFLYVNRQGDEKVSVYAFDPSAPQMLSLLQVISVRDAAMTGKTEPAAIRLCPGRDLLAVSNRGMGTQHREDSITLFAVDPGTGELMQQAVVRTGGEMPRDFCFTPDGAFLVAGYQFQGYLDVYRVDAEEGTLRYVCRGPEIPSPVCLAF